MGKDNQFDDFLKNGFLIVKDQIPTISLHQLVFDLTSCVEQKINLYNKTLDSVVLQEMNIRFSYKNFQSIANNTDILELGRSLLQTSDVKIWHDQLLLKPAINGNESHWHQDYPFWPMLNPDAITCWIPLCKVDKNNGCLRFIPGSHKWENHPTVLPISYDDLKTLCPDDQEPTEFDACMNLGDISFHHGLVFHGAQANIANQTRVAVKIIYMKGNTRFRNSSHFITDKLSLADGDIMRGEIFSI